eukprot:758314-Hanusia_phi.AAC.8
MSCDRDKVFDLESQSGTTAAARLETVALIAVDALGRARPPPRPESERESAGALSRPMIRARRRAARRRPG